MSSAMKLAIILLYCYGAASSKKTPVERSYFSSISTQGLQHFYSNGAPSVVYQNVPVYVPSQVGVVSYPAGPQQVPIPQPSFEPSRPPRPSYPPKESGGSIDPSVDLTGSTLPQAGSTYGPPKPYDITYRKPYGGSYRSYIRYKGPRGPPPRPTRPMVYTHAHKGHLHTHYYPPTPPSGPGPKPSSYLPPNHIYPSSTPPPTPTEDPQKVYNYHAHPPTGPSSSHPGPSSGLSSFATHPVNPGGSTTSSNAVGDLTQALIGPSGYIRNYDTSIPVKIPNQKPNSHQVKEILKNADFHFIDVSENRPTTPSSILHHSYPLPSDQGSLSQDSYQIGHHQTQSGQTGFQGASGGAAFQGHHTASYQTHPTPYNTQGYQVHQITAANLPHHLQGHQIPVKSYAELYDHRFQGPINYQNNRIEHDSSDTVKVPVAVFKGVLPAGVYPVPLPVERSDQDSTNHIPADFSPSPLVPSFSPSTTITSDWKPITGNSVFAPKPKTEAVRNLNHFGDHYFADINREPNYDQKNKDNFRENKFYVEQSPQHLPVPQKLSSESESFGIEVTSNFPKKQVSPVGDIISGRIPGDHNPFESLGREKRKGTVLDGASSTTISKVSDVSNLVVSSSIKFSR